MSLLWLVSCLRLLQRNAFVCWCNRRKFIAAVYSLRLLPAMQRLVRCSHNLRVTAFVVTGCPFNVRFCVRVSLLTSIAVYCFLLLAALFFATGTVDTTVHMTPLTPPPFELLFAVLFASMPLHFLLGLCKAYSLAPH